VRDVARALGKEVLVDPGLVSVYQQGSLLSETICVITQAAFINLLDKYHMGIELHDPGAVRGVPGQRLNTGTDEGPERLQDSNDTRRGSVNARGCPHSVPVSRR